LLRCLAGLERPQKAYLCVNGKIWHDEAGGIFLPPEQREIGYVFQEGALFPKMTVQKNLLFGYRRTRRDQRTESVDRVIDLLGLRSLLERYPHSLSGGEKQRVAIGRALLNQPRLLLMDEPMASLDADHKKEILPYLENLQRNFRIPIIYITHDREELARIANYLVVVENGRVVTAGPLNTVLTDLSLLMTREQEAAATIEATVSEQDRSYFLTRLSFVGGDLSVNWIDREPGSPVRVRILAKDVAIALQKPEQTSIINVLPAIIESMQVHGRGRMMVRLDLGGARVLARITQKSQQRLDLKTGDAVFALIKTVALVV